MNEFSIICRVLGSFYYRHPQDPVLAPLFTLLHTGKLRTQWPLEQDELLQQLERSTDLQQLETDYTALFSGKACKVSPYGSHWEAGLAETEIRAFLTACGMSLSAVSTDHIGQLLLAASWLEDQLAEDDVVAQITLFDHYLLPWCAKFFGKAEAHAETPFYRALAIISREAVQVMRDELAESEVKQRNEQMR
ncbi:molecular chaperone [Enterobacteriaceae bacterium LUAb1]